MSNRLPIFFIHEPSSFAWSIDFINVPLPTLISNTNPDIPSAIFLLIIEPQIKGIDATVPVLLLREYIFLSAGHISIDWDIIAYPFSSTHSLN